MGISVGLWKVADSVPERIAVSTVDLERDLEDWIEHDPTMLQHGLVIVGRQVRTEAGPLDLLALDAQGRWVVVEIKRGAVRRETIAQAIDYASCVSKMPFSQLETQVNCYLAETGGSTLAEILTERSGEVDREESRREIDLIVVGTTRDSGLERMVGFLSGHTELSLSVVTFEVFDAGDGTRILVRGLTDSDTATPSTPQLDGMRVDTPLQLADEAGVGDSLRLIMSAAEECGLYARPYKTSIMFAPPAHHGRCLFVVWSKPNKAGELKVYVVTSAFEEFFGFTPKDVEACLGMEGYHHLAPDKIPPFLTGLRELFNDRK